MEVARILYDKICSFKSQEPKAMKTYLPTHFVHPISPNYDIIIHEEKYLI